MLAVPTEIQAKYDAALIRKSAPVRHHFYYKKWLRYYPDFCHKYRHPPSEQQSLVLFTDKLRQKTQKEFQVRQASHEDSGDTSLIYSFRSGFQ